jgi:hypothetical protein
MVVPPPHVRRWLGVETVASNCCCRSGGLLNQPRFCVQLSHVGRWCLVPSRVRPVYRARYRLPGSRVIAPNERLPIEGDRQVVSDTCQMSESSWPAVTAPGNCSHSSNCRSEAHSARSRAPAATTPRSRETLRVPSRPPCSASGHRARPPVSTSGAQVEKVPTGRLGGEIAGVRRADVDAGRQLLGHGDAALP